MRSNSPAASADDARLLLVSADGHASTTPETYRPYLATKHQRSLDILVEEDAHTRQVFETLYPLEQHHLDVIDQRGAIRSGGLAGAFDVARRLREMDSEGVAAEIIISNSQLHAMPFFSTVNRPHSHELQVAGARAYNRWIGDCIVEGRGRLFAVGYPGPSRDMETLLAELKWLAEHGFTSVPVPDLVEDLDRPSLSDPYFDRFWAACADYGMVLSVHAGHGRAQGETLSYLTRIAQATRGTDRNAALLALNSEKDSVFSALDMRPRRVLWELMLAGVFDRHPSLHFALTEVRGDWIPATVRWLDQRFAQGDTPIKRQPSEYWTDNCFVGLSFMHRAEVVIRDQIGIGQMMFGRDYPHPEGTWPNTLEWLRDALRGVPVAEARGILGENALRCYPSLDRPALRALADRVGPSVDQILGDDSPIAADLLDDFQTRGGYAKPVEDVNTRHIEACFADDLAATVRR